MKPNPHHRITIPLTIAALCFTVSSCDQRAATNAATDQKSAELADQLAKLEAEKLSVAADKVEATRLRDESERLRAEAEIRQAIAKLSETPAPAAEVKPAAEVEKPVASTETVPPPAEVNVPQVTLSSEVDALPPLPPLPPIETDVSYEPFYDELSDEGSWMESEDYGYVWQPGIVSEEWEPYTDGGWIYTEYGWTWETHESFGSICYHYGRWTRLRGIGWVWVPGREWAPAWVSWRYADDCVGWAPLPPRARFVSGVGIHSWVDGVCHLAPTNYYFVSIQNICHPRSRDVLFSKAECEQRYLRSRNVTNLTEIRDSSKRSIVRCDGLPMDLLRKHLGSRLVEKKVEFDFSGRKPDRFVDKNNSSKVVTVPHWNFDRHAGAGKLEKPKQIGRKIGRALDVVHLPGKENRLAIRKLMAEEASSGLKQLPPRIDRGTRKDESGRNVAQEIKPNREHASGERIQPEKRPEITQVAPPVTQPQTRPLPPVQKPLVPVPAPTPTPNVREIVDAQKGDKPRPGFARPAPPSDGRVETIPFDDPRRKEIPNFKPFGPGEKAPERGGAKVPAPSVVETPNANPAIGNPSVGTRPPVVSIPPRTEDVKPTVPVRPSPQIIDGAAERLREARELSQKQEEEWRKRRAEKEQADQQAKVNLQRAAQQDMQLSKQREQQANLAEEAAKRAAAQSDLVARQHQDELKQRQESIQRQQDLLQRSKNGSPQMSNPPGNDAQRDLAQQAEAAREQSRLRRVEELKQRQLQEEAQNQQRAKEKSMVEEQKNAELKNRAEREEKQREATEKLQDANRRNQQMEQAEEAKKLQQQNAQREAMQKAQMEQAEERVQQQRENLRKQQEMEQRRSREEAESRQQQDNMRRSQEAAQRRVVEEARERQQEQQKQESMRREAEESNRRQQIEAAAARQREESSRRSQEEKGKEERRGNR